MDPRVYATFFWDKNTSMSYTVRLKRTWPVFWSLERICTMGLPPASTSSTLSSTLCATHIERSCISMRMGKVGGA